MLWILGGGDGLQAYNFPSQNAVAQEFSVRRQPLPVTKESLDYMNNFGHNPTCSALDTEGQAPMRELCAAPLRWH